MSLSTAEALRLLTSCWPQGSDSHYDLSPSGDIYKWLLAKAAVVADQQAAIDLLRLELNPATMTQKIADWETACGLSQTKIARFGTTAQRRAQVLAVLRSFGSSFSLPDIRAIAQPFLLYADPSQIQILEADRTALDNLHTQADANIYTLGMGAPSNTLVNFDWLDDGAVSPAGARIYLNLTANLEDLWFDLFGPSGFRKTWPQGYLGTGAVTAQDYYLYAPEAAGHPIYGVWTLAVTSDGTHSNDVNIHALTMDGLGRDAAGGDGLGAAMYEWAVVADPALIGTGADLDGLYQVLQRIRPAHTRAFVVRKNTVVGGGLAAIPDDPATIPDAAVPGT